MRTCKVIEPGPKHLDFLDIRATKVAQTAATSGCAIDFDEAHLSADATLHHGNDRGAPAVLPRMEGTQPELLQQPSVETRAEKGRGEPTRENGCHALGHLYASISLHEGESIKALSEYLGHADPGFTLRT